MDLDKVLERVRKLVNLAEHPGTGKEEADAARAQADSLMLKYAIEEVEADKLRPVNQHQKPGIIIIPLDGHTDFLGYICTLSQVVARYCRCQIRHYTRYNHNENHWESKVYGFESDLRYFEILYTTLRLHMLGAIMPKPDPDKSIEENAYILHNAGLNWMAIAKEHGWDRVPREPGDTSKAMYVNRFNKERRTWAGAVTIFEKAYYRAVEARGEQPVKIPPRGAETFKRSAAQGYVTRISQRLHEVQEGRLVGSDIILRSRLEDINDLFKEDNPDLFKQREVQECEACNNSKTGYCRAHKPRKYIPPPFSQAGYSAGVNHANTASLNPQATAARKGELS